MEYQVIQNVKKIQTIQQQKNENNNKNKNTCDVSVCAFIQVQSACKSASVWQMIKAATVCKWLCVVGATAAVQNAAPKRWCHCQTISKKLAQKHLWEKDASLWSLVSCVGWAKNVEPPSLSPLRTALSNTD